AERPRGAPAVARVLPGAPAAEPAPGRRGRGVGAARGGGAPPQPGSASGADVAGVRPGLARSILARRHRLRARTVERGDAGAVRRRLGRVPRGRRFRPGSRRQRVGPAAAWGAGLDARTPRRPRRGGKRRRARGRRCPVEWVLAVALDGAGAWCALPCRPRPDRGRTAAPGGTRGRVAAVEDPP